MTENNELPSVLKSSEKPGWDGPGWYFEDESGALHGPFASKEEAKQAATVYNDSWDPSGCEID